MLNSVVVFISDPSRIEIHSVSRFNELSNKNIRSKMQIVYTELYHNSYENCLEWCKKHKLELTFE